MAKIPTERPIFEVKKHILSREEEISQYMAHLDLPEDLAEAVYEAEEYATWLAD